MLEYIEIIPILSVIIVSILGIITNIIVIRYSQKQNILSKLVDRYFVIRDNITHILSDYVSLKTTNDYSVEQLNIYCNQVSKIYYEYYDFLPKEVLHELICLYANLSDTEHRLYTMKDHSLALLEKKDMDEFLQNITIIDNNKQFIYYNLFGNDAMKKKFTSINIQSRKVLSTMNQYFTLNNLLYLNKRLQKR